ncbi:ndufs4 NADH dehydrogenase Fe-S protein subunit [Rhodotorula kratochvilovae]
MVRSLVLHNFTDQQRFNSEEDAVHFAEKQGWEYYVQRPNVQKFVTKSYANNYNYSAKKLRIHHTK